MGSAFKPITFRKLAFGVSRVEEFLLESSTSSFGSSYGVVFRPAGVSRGTGKMSASYGVWMRHDQPPVQSIII